MKYNFEDLIGNNTTLQLIRNSLRKNVFPHFAIFSGIMGTGKSTSAKATALALTCEDKSEGRDRSLACCSCINCQSAIASFATTGQSTKIRIVNVAEFNDIDDVKNLIKDIFVLQSGTQNKVYVLEEAHTLKNIKGAQTAFLEEIDRIPDNVYIIMCTTEEGYIKKELKSRAIVFNFKRLSDKESSLLLDRLISKNGYNSLDSNVKRLLIKNARGIPRNMENVLDFISNSEASTEEIKDFMQVISDEIFIEMFSAMKSNDISLVIQYLDSLCGTRSIDVIVRELKRFVLDVMFYFEGGITDTFSKSERDEIKAVFSDNDTASTELVLKVANEIDRWGSNIDENTFKLHFFKLRLVFQERKISNVFGGKERIANYERSVGANAQQEITEVEDEYNIRKLARVNSKPVHSFK